MVAVVEVTAGLAVVEATAVPAAENSAAATAAPTAAEVAVEAAAPTAQWTERASRSGRTFFTAPLVHAACQNNDLIRPPGLTLSRTEGSI